MIRTAAGTVLGGVAFLFLLELAPAAEQSVRRRLRRIQEALASRPCRDWTERRARW